VSQNIKRLFAFSSNPHPSVHKLELVGRTRRRSKLSFVGR